MRIAPCLALLLFAACSEGGDPAPRDGAARVKKVAMIPKGTVHEFWKSVEKGARRADLELADLEIVWKGPAGEGDAGAQISVLESFLAERYDGVLLSPLDAKALVKPVQAAVAAGTPVVLFDSGLAGGEESWSSYIATDNDAGGRLAAREMARMLSGKGRVWVFPYMAGSESTEQRERGFLDEMKQHPGIQIVLADRFGGPDESKAVEVAESVMASIGTELDGVFCSNEPCTSGFLTVLERDPRKLADKLVVVGFDSGAKINAALASGLLEGTVLQDPVAIGYESVRAMHAVLSKQPVQKRTSTRQALATPANMATPEIRALLFPLESP
ncbi:MAG: D-allose-binding periplasmic protein precursor [Planctomycetota bacterium]